MSSNCPCDVLVFPAQLQIAPGLVQLQRQIGTFPDFRQALLARVPAFTPLAEWRARDISDFGLMLLEMWAVLADTVSFYDEVIAHELYLRTARLRPSVRKLTGLLGYIPRPASSSSVVLAAIADGKIAVAVPARSGFRSGAFAGNPPQVFETSSDRAIHPAFNSWPLQTVRSATFQDSAAEQNFLLSEPESVAVKPDDFVLLAAGSYRRLLQVSAVSPFQGVDGASYTRIEFTTATGIPAGTRVDSLRLLQPGAIAGLWKQTSLSPFAEIPTQSRLLLDGLYRQIQSGDYLLVGREDDQRWFQVRGVEEPQTEIIASITTETKDPNGNVVSSVTSPPVTTPITRLLLDTLITDPDRGVPGQSYQWTSANTDVTVRNAMTEAAHITVEAKPLLEASDPLRVDGRPFLPADVNPPGSFLLEDSGGRGVAVNGTLNFVDGTLTLSQGSNWEGALTAPVSLYGNLLPATRGESVAAESLGVADATVPRRTFKLKKKPLSYVPSPVAGNLTGVASTLAVYVDNVRWTEVSSFFGIQSDAQVYIVRQDDQSNTLVTLNGLRAGATVTAYYRYGAEAAAPPADSITQIVRPVAGLRSVNNPVAAGGGSDAEDAGEIRIFAPRSALLLGRAISIPDLEAAASIQPGVRSASAGWRWNRDAQAPVIQIFYIGAESIQSQVAQTLRDLTDSVTPVRVDLAIPVVRSLSLDILIDDRYLRADVLAQVRSLLLEPQRGLLTPEVLGIGKPLFRSVLFQAVLGVPGALAVHGFSVEGFSNQQFGISPGFGKYLDFEAGGLILNGEAV